MSPNLRALLVASVASTLLVALLDAAPAGAAQYRQLPALLPAVVALTVVHVFQLFAATFALVACVAVADRFGHDRGSARVLRSLLPWLGAALAVWSARTHLVVYAPFAKHLPANAALLCAFIGTGVACSGPWGRGEPARSLLARVLQVAIPILAQIGAAAAGVAAAKLHVDDYPTLRLTLVQLAHLLLTIGLWYALRRAPSTRLERWSNPWLVATVLVVVFGVERTSALDLGRPFFLARTTLGSSLASLHPYDVDDERPQHDVPDDPEGVARFLHHAQLPELPRDLDLTRYNVLWLMAEATRFDQTSLGRKADTTTTPNLLKLRQEGAFSWKRAFAPSSGTFLSLSSIFGAGLPSMLKLETWQKPWTGELLEPGPVSLFSKAGHHTFWVSHNNATCFTNTVLGVQAGFDERRMFRGATTDPKIADALIALLREHAATGEPFFGFGFFVSPHSPYSAHFKDMPRRTSLERYRQELRYMDAQLGRVLDALQKLDLAKRTIVIFAGDHGEEFGDHGGYYHKATVYSESLRVPLLIRVPGIEGGTRKQPTSLSYVMPWLLLHGTPQMRAFAEDRMKRQFGPMLDRTQGAVIAEVLGHDRMKSTLIYPDLKLNYDFRAQRTEVYRFDDDPRERRDLFLKDPQLGAEAMKRIAAYREVRAARRRFTLRPDKLDPRDAPGD